LGERVGLHGARREGDDASIDVDTGTDGSIDSGSGVSKPDTSTPSTDSGGSGSDATVSTDGGDAGTNPSDAHADGNPNGTDGGGGGFDACVPTITPLVCDPVCNTGCTGLNRCDVSDTTNSGSCIGAWIQGEGTACLPKTATTDPCAPSLTCVSGVCVRLCYHNSDCPTAGATCCKQSVPTSTGAASGFMSCTACTP
jgi:hypothetical protein